MVNLFPLYHTMLLRFGADSKACFSLRSVFYFVKSIDSSVRTSLSSVITIIRYLRRSVSCGAGRRQPKCQGLLYNEQEIPALHGLGGVYGAVSSKHFMFGIDTSTSTRKRRTYTNLNT